MGALQPSRQGPVLTLELANPGKANALDLEILAQLDDQVTQVQADDSVRAVVLRGSAGGTFSSGADIRQWAPMTPEQFGRDWIAHGNAIFRRFEQLRCPTVAAIEGLCFGGGLEE
jgi:enoyl-CoA hydratase